MNHFLLYCLGSKFWCSLDFPFVLIGFLSWFALCWLAVVGFSIALNSFSANILFGSFLGSSIFRRVNYLMLEKCLGGWLTMSASICYVE